MTVTVTVIWLDHTYGRHVSVSSLTSVSGHNSCRDKLVTKDRKNGRISVNDFLPVVAAARTERRTVVNFMLSEVLSMYHVSVLLNAAVR